MKKQLFPKELLASTYEVHQFNYSKRSQYIYVSILLLLLAIGFSLPFINVSIYITARGITKTKEEKTPLRLTKAKSLNY